MERGMKGVLSIDSVSEQVIQATMGELGALKSQVVATTQRALSLALSSATQFRQHWRECCLAVAGGRVEEVHLMRAELLRTLENRLKLLRQVHSEASVAATLEDRELAGSEELPRVIAGLERFRG